MSGRGSQLPKRFVSCVALFASLFGMSCVLDSAYAQSTNTGAAKPKVDPNAPLVTGKVILPDGSPAVGIVVMTATDKHGWGEGFTNGNYTKTDEQGRYKIVSKKWFPQRIFWLPDDYENNSRAVTGKGGEQAVIQLREAPVIRGRVVERDGTPVTDIMVQANGAARTPMTWARTDETGAFEFRPLPPGKYFLRPVRTFHSATDGKMTFESLPFPFNAVEYVLSDSGGLPPATITAPETVKIRVDVVDGSGKPLTGQRLSIGDIGDYVNAIIAKEVKGKPGVYEFKFPKGRYIRDIALRHSWDEIAYYQETANEKPLPAEAIVLGKANKDISGIKVTLRKAGRIEVQLVHADGKPYANERIGVDVKHPASLSPSNRSTVAPQPAHTVPRRHPGLHVFQEVVPDVDVKVSIYGDNIVGSTKTVRVAEGETKRVTLTVIEKAGQEKADPK